jgi:hypothetical protein
VQPVIVPIGFKAALHEMSVKIVKVLSAANKKEKKCLLTYNTLWAALSRFHAQSTSNKEVDRQLQDLVRVYDHSGTELKKVNK